MLMRVQIVDNARDEKIMHAANKDIHESASDASYDVHGP
jgi:hypothetical protein